MLAQRMFQVWTCPWVVLGFRTGSSKSSAEQVLSVFRAVVTELLGWALDPEKDAVGSSMVFLSGHT